jgi:beta-glucosidase
MTSARRRKALGGVSCGAALVLAAGASVCRASDSVSRAQMHQATRPLYEDPRASLDARVEDLLVRLTPQEKVSLLAGGSAFATQPIARLGIPALRFSDGPNGVRSNEGRATTAFPTGSALAATWNPEVLEEVGQAIGREALALDVQVMLGPDVNIQRSPLAGRNFEDYSEDPFLAGTLGAAFVRGVQSQGVGTSVKHFVANEQELERLRSSSNVDERTLREIYLRPFEMIVKEAHPWTVMVSYNRVNGIYMSENRRLIHDVLQGEWAFDGLVMSDWGAVHSTEDAARSGLDLEMPGPPRYFGDRLNQAVHNWQVDESLIDEAARRVLQLIIRSGALDGRSHPRGELRSPRNRAAALHAASEAVVLLKNARGLLPLDRAHLRSLAIVGPDADVPLYGGGGSSHVISGSTATPLESLRRLTGGGVRILYARGCDNDSVPPPADVRLLSPTASRSVRGLAFSYYASASFEGRPVLTGIETSFEKSLITGQLGALSARWEGYLWAPEDGTYELSLSGVGDAQLYLEGRELIGAHRERMLPPQFDYGAPLRLASVALEKGKRYRIRIDYERAPSLFPSLNFGLRLPPASIEQAVRTAKQADAAIVFVGSSHSSETEGRDRPDMRLEGHQDELVEAVLAANPNTIVVLESGAPYGMPWAGQAPAIIEAWLDGEEGPEALARVLLGHVNPSGKLPFSFPRRLEDNPAYLYYSGGREANYGEGVFVGYRYYDKRGVEPLFPFGHGLSYTAFEYRNLRMPATVPVGQSISVSLEVRNSGQRSGEETVQLYVGDEATTEVVRPVKELEGFRKVALGPGETKTVTFVLPPRALSYYDIHRHDWVSTPGAHRILIGSSSRDIRLERDFEWTAHPEAPPQP